MHLFKRSRADKEYADALQKINQSSERSAQFPVSTTSPVVQVRDRACGGREHFKKEGENTNKSPIHIALLELTCNTGIHVMMILACLNIVSTKPTLL